MTRVERLDWYTHAREKYATTIHEFETLMGWPPFTLYPKARGARTPADTGFFMYPPTVKAEAFAEEDRMMRCLLELGMGYEEVAQIFNTSYRRVYKRIPNMGTRTRFGPQRKVA